MPYKTKDTIDYKLEDFEEKNDDITEYRTKLTLTPEQEIELINVIEANLTAIEKERNEDKCVQRWEQYENQYWGVLRPNSDMLFNTHVFMTLRHCRRAKSRIYQAFFESDPIFSMSVRPGNAKKEGFESAELQEQMLDYELDSEIEIKSPMRKTLHSAILLDGGMIKLIWQRDKEWMKRKEEYKGDEEGLKDFLENYPNAREKYPDYISQLENGLDITIMASKEETVYDAPAFDFVEFKDFFISLNTKGLKGLKKSRFYAERQKYNWHEFLEEVEEERFDKDKVEELKWVMNKDKVELDTHYIDREYTVFETNLFYDLSHTDKPRRIVVWYNKDRKKILSAIEFPYEHGKPYYIPFFITDEMSGWHQPGFGRILQPRNIVANATINLTLDSAFYQNTPILRANPNSSVASQLLAKTWKIGDPLIAEKGEVEKFDLRSGNLSDMVMLGNVNEHLADEASGVGSPYLSGKADPTDPDAPAKKTMALINETNINIKDYILCLLPSFQEMAYQLLQLFAQYKDTVEFGKKKRNVLGKSKIFKITAEQLRLRTNVTPGALSFNFDKLNEKRENLALVQFLTTNQTAQKFLSQMPQAEWAMFDILIKSWSNFWSLKSSEVWPTEKQVKDFMVNVQKEAMEKIYQEKVKENQSRMMGMAGGQPGGMPGVPQGMPQRPPLGGMNV